MAELECRQCAGVVVKESDASMRQSHRQSAAQHDQAAHEVAVVWAGRDYG